MEEDCGEAVSAPALVKIDIDTSPGVAELVSLQREMFRLNQLAAKCFEDGFELVALDLDKPGTACAGDCRTILKPTDKLVLLVSALRAFNRDTGVRIGCPLDVQDESFQG